MTCCKIIVELSIRAMFVTLDTWLAFGMNSGQFDLQQLSGLIDVS